MFKLRTVVAFGLLAMLGFSEASAQVFPNAFWNRGKQSECSGGVCENGVSAVVVDSPVPNLISSAPSVNYVPYVSNYPSVSQATGGGSAGSFNGGSSGGFGVGTRLPDGAIVTSVGVTVSPQATAEVSQLRIGDRASFRKSLLAAARNARDAGEITSLEFFLLSASSRNPAVLERMQAAVHEAAIEEGLATTQAIDWEGLIQFIEKLIPIIIKLIELFGQAQMEATPMYAASYMLAPVYSLAA